MGSEGKDAGWVGGVGKEASGSLYPESFWKLYPERVWSLCWAVTGGEGGRGSVMKGQPL